MYKLKLVGIAILAMYLLIISLLYFVDYSKALSGFNGPLNNIAKQDIKVRVFPIPNIEIKSYKAEDISFNSATCWFSIFSLLALKPQVNYISFGSLYISSNKTSLNLLNNSLLMLEMRNARRLLASDIDVHVNELFIFSKDPEGLIDLIFDQVKIQDDKIIMHHKNEIITISDLSNKDNNIIEYKVNHPFYSIVKTEIYNNNKSTGGNLNFDIKKLSELHNSFIFQSQNVSTDLPALAVKLSANYKIQDDILTLNEFSVNSSALQISGNGFYSQKKEVDATLSFNIGTVDLNQIFVSSNNNFLPNSIWLPEDIANMNINIEKIICNNETLKDIKILTKDNDIKILSGNILSGGDFDIKGTLSKNDYRAMFEGNIALNHKDINSMLNNLNLKYLATEQDNLPFKLYSEIRLTQLDMQLLNIIAQIDDIILNAKYTNKNLAQNPYINTLIEFTNLDLTSKKYPFFSYIQDYSSLFLPKEDNNLYQGAINSLRKLTYLGHLDIIAHKLKFMDDVFVQSFMASIDFQPSIISLSYFNFINKTTSATGTGSFSVTNIKPFLALDINFDNASFFNDSIENSFNYLLHLGKTYDLTKANFSLKSKINKLLENKINNLMIDLSNDNTVININNITANYGNGNFQVNGNGGLNPVMLNLGYALNSFPSEFITSSVNNIIPFSGGVFSLGGSLYGIGESLNQFIYTIVTDGTFLGKSINYNYLGIDKFIDLINNKDYVVDNLNNDFNNYLVSQDTNFDQITGRFELIKGIIRLEDFKFTTPKSSNILSLHYNLYNHDIQAKALSSFYVFNFKYPNNINAINASNLVSISLDIDGNLLNMKKTSNLEALSNILIKRAQ